MRSKRSFSFRADQALPSARDTYCRFSLFEETYDSVDDARRRLATLHDEFPQVAGGPEDDEYTRTMRTGFRVGTITYVLQTDGAIFWDEVQRLAKALAQSTTGAELTDAIIDAPPSKSLQPSVQQERCDFSDYKPLQLRAATLGSPILSMPGPEYPAEARERKVAGPVTVRVLVNARTGRVEQACAVDGDEILKMAAEVAALKVQLSPYNDYIKQKYTYAAGVVIYNFVAQ